MQLLEIIMYNRTQTVQQLKIEIEKGIYIFFRLKFCTLAISLLSKKKNKTLKYSHKCSWTHKCSVEAGDHMYRIQTDESTTVKHGLFTYYQQFVF